VAKNILKEIVQTKRKALAAAKAERPLADVEAAAADAPPARDFFAACTSPPARLVNVIAEVKKASPSAGVICEDFGPARIAGDYAAAGASAISVLTDEPYFQGSLEYLRIVRATADLPVLRKDFIIDPYQVHEARAAGADAILLIGECLSPDEMRELAALAASLGMTCLVEVHGPALLAQVQAAIAASGAERVLLGINNRDLTTFTVDVGATIRLAEGVEDRTRLVSESGIRTREDVQRLADAGIRSVLIGETLMRAPDIRAAFDELFGPVG